MGATASHIMVQYFDPIDIFKCPVDSYLIGRNKYVGIQDLIGRLSW